MSQEIYTNYLNDKVIMQKLYQAKDFEQEYFDGHKLGDNSLLKSWIAKETGLWESVLILPYGKIYFASLDASITKVSVISFETRLKVEPPEIREFEIDFKNTMSIKEAKDYFKNDPVMKNTFVDSYESRTLAEVLPLVIKSFRSKFLSYNREFSFLWQKTKLNSALSVFDEMKNQNLIFV